MYRTERRNCTPSYVGAAAIWIQLYESYSQLHRSDRCVESDGNLDSELLRSDRCIEPNAGIVLPVL